jgi:FkbM family methyltransferase
MFKPFEYHFNFYKKLKSFNVTLNNFVDGGCHQGSWTKRVKEIYPNANYYMIDAQDIHKDELEKLGNFYCVGLGQNDEERDFYFAKDKNKSTGSSLYEENTNIEFDKRKIQVKKLSNVIPDQNYDVIKLDLQGAELEVIEGSLDLFEKTKWVQLECPVYHNNKGAPFFEHYINYMANCNFKVFDIDNVFLNGKLMGIDFIFNNQTLPQVSSLEGEIHYEETK